MIRGRMPGGNAERWHRLTSIFHRALARGPASRQFFLQETCKGDPSLRAEVEALIAAHNGAGSFGSISPTEAAPRTPPLEPGTRLGPYRIEWPIGSGGMGVIYKAWHSRLERTAALKVLHQGALLDAP